MNYELTADEDLPAYMWEASKFHDSSLPSGGYRSDLKFASEPGLTFTYLGYSSLNGYTFKNTAVPSESYRVLSTGQRGQFTVTDDGTVYNSNPVERY